MSQAGHWAQRHMKAVKMAARFGRLLVPGMLPGLGVDGSSTDATDSGTDDGIDNNSAGDEGDDGYTENPFGGNQAETSIAVDSTGMHVVVGVNDTRGFNVNPTRVSGIQYSDDGGVTWTDGGQLPVTTGTSAIGSTLYPQVFGDPAVKYLGGSNFVYASIMVKKIGTSGTAQTMCVHVSNDYGHTWQGPYEVTSATNPHGLLSGVNARDAADKEFIDWDPVHSRLMLTWSNFTSTAFAPGGVEISETHCDNILSGSPTWSPRNILGKRAEDGQASCPAFHVGTNDVYVVWRAFPGGNFNNVGFSVSHDNGNTWSPATDITSNFFTMDSVHGNDRNNTSPSIAVDSTGGPNAGTIYVVYANNNLHDGADIAFQRSTDGGATFSSPVKINANPGHDGPQWFPWVTVDQTSGRAHVFYNDQRPLSGDVMEVSRQYSDDGGVTWSVPQSVNDRPFHGGYGNDTGQPNLGDYNMAVAQNGLLYLVYAGTPNRVDYNDGEPSSLSFNCPFTVIKVLGSDRAALSLGNVTFTNARGSSTVDAGGRVHFHLPLVSYANTGFTNVSATLSTTNANVTVLSGASTYPNIAALSSSTNNSDFVVQLGSSYVPGTPLELRLAVTSDQGTTNLQYTQFTGTPVATTVFSENFDPIQPGWATSHAGGNNVVPWVLTSNVFGDGTTVAFHQNKNDGLGGNSVRFERLFSPLFTIPAGADYVTIDFDIGYNTEDDPNFNVLDYDGCLLRVTDQTPGHALRSVQLEACAEDFTTGNSPYYPKMFPRSSNSAYFQDMQNWGGLSNGMKHVHAKLHGVAGDRLQLRFEYTQDSNGTGADVHPAADNVYGVAIDNIVVKSVQSTLPPNHAPVAVNDNLSTNQEVLVTGNVQSNDTDADGDALTTSLVSGPANGSLTLNGDGSFSYTPNAGFYGVDTFTYKDNDGLADSNVATVSITVDGKPTAVPSSPASVTVPHDGNPLTNTVSFNLDGSASTDPEHETLTYLWKLGATTVGNTAVVSVTETPGTYTFTLTVTDTHGQSSTASTTTVVNPEPNNPPVANAGSDQTLEATGINTPVTLDGSASSDPDSDPITYLWKEGSTTLGTTAIVNTSLPLGVHHITLTVTDSYGATNSANVTVTVRDTTPPVISGVSASPNSIWPPNKSMIPVTVNYTVSDNHDTPSMIATSLSITCNEPTGAGDMVVVDSHHVSLKADRLGNGSGRVYTITITATDTSGNTSHATVTVTVPHDQGH